MFPSISRRSFLKGCILIGAGAATSLIGTWYFLLRKPIVIKDLQVLSNAEYRTLEAIVATTLGRWRNCQIAEAARDLPLAFDRYLADEPAPRQAELKMALLLVECGPLLFDGIPLPFSLLNDEDRLTNWQGWAESNLLIRRKVSIALRKFFNLLFYDDDSVGNRIGFTGPQ